MKKIFFIILTGFFLQSCDRHQDTDVLPEATQEGKNTGGALVDGKVWVAKIENTSASPGGNNTYLQSDPITGREIMTIVLRNYQNPSSDAIEMDINSTQAITTGTYLLNGIYENHAVIKNGGNGYYTDDNNNTGSITLTKFDRSKGIISGTFQFKAKNNAGNVITVTEGRFDRRFQ
jgi:hypothetical protein